MFGRWGWVERELRFCRYSCRLAGLRSVGDSQGTRELLIASQFQVLAVGLSGEAVGMSHRNIDRITASHRRRDETDPRRCQHLPWNLGRPPGSRILGWPSRPGISNLRSFSQIFLQTSSQQSSDLSVSQFMMRDARNYIS